MGIRFRKSLKIAPGIRVNLNGSGASLTLGGRGASVNIGKRGAYLNAGIPGTGISMRERLAASQGEAKNKKSMAQSPERRKDEVVKEEVHLVMGAGGEALFRYPNGSPVPESLAAAALAQNFIVVTAFMDERAEEVNRDFLRAERIHFHTPDPSISPAFKVREFDLPKPAQPTKDSIGLLRSMFKSQRDRVEKKYSAEMHEYRRALVEWNESRKEFFSRENRRKRLVERDIYSDLDAMSQYLESTLESIDWVRETIVSFDVIRDGKVVFLDVDLPEEEDMPVRTASVSKRGDRVLFKDLGPTAIRKLYMSHIHGVAFRLIGEVFAALPVSKEVVFSGYSQRVNSSSGHVEDEYLISVWVSRDEWAKLAFNNIQAISVVDALARFNLRRKMTKTGVFKPISPFSPADTGGI